MLGEKKIKAMFNEMGLGKINEIDFQDLFKKETDFSGKKVDSIIWFHTNLAFIADEEVDNARLA